MLRLISNPESVDLFLLPLPTGWLVQSLSPPLAVPLKFDLVFIYLDYGDAVNNVPYQAQLVEKCTVPLNSLQAICVSCTLQVCPDRVHRLLFVLGQRNHRKGAA